VADLHKIYDHGIVVNGGFILGFDDETSTCAASMIDVIERGNIVMAMIGLLYALPNTQLTRRLQKEHRLLKGFGRLSAENEAMEVDQATSGLNFITKRPRAEVLDDFLHVLGQTYSTKNYFDRCLRLAKVIRVEPRFKPNWKRKLRYASAFLECVVALGVRPSTAYLFWRNIGILLLTRISAVETAVNVMAMYLHFGPQTEFISGLTVDGVRKLGRSRGDQSDASVDGERDALDTVFASFED
jgi:hypothetical protein